jgi:hypothetical protein
MLNAKDVSERTDARCISKMLRKTQLIGKRIAKHTAKKAFKLLGAERLKDTL